MGRVVSEVELGRVTKIVLQMIGVHRGRPCPTRRQIMQWTGLPRREVWPFLKSLAEGSPPLIELEERLHDRAGMRRLRLAGGDWTGWTMRRSPSIFDHAMKRRIRREVRHG